MQKQAKMDLKFWSTKCIETQLYIEQIEDTKWKHYEKKRNKTDINRSTENIFPRNRKEHKTELVGPSTSNVAISSLNVSKDTLNCHIQRTVWIWSLLTGIWSSIVDFGNIQLNESFLFNKLSIYKKKPSSKMRIYGHQPSSVNLSQIKNSKY